MYFLKVITLFSSLLACTFSSWATEEKVERGHYQYAQGTFEHFPLSIKGKAVAIFSKSPYLDSFRVLCEHVKSLKNHPYSEKDLENFPKNGRLPTLKETLLLKDLLRLSVSCCQLSSGPEEKKSVKGWANSLVRTWGTSLLSEPPELDLENFGTNLAPYKKNLTTLDHIGKGFRSIGQEPAKIPRVIYVYVQTFFDDLQQQENAFTTVGHALFALAQQEGNGFVKNLHGLLTKMGSARKPLQVTNTKTFWTEGDTSPFMRHILRGALEYYLFAEGSPLEGLTADAFNEISQSLDRNYISIIADHRGCSVTLYSPSAFPVDPQRLSGTMDGVLHLEKFISVIEGLKKAGFPVYTNAEIQKRFSKSRQLEVGFDILKVFPLSEELNPDNVIEREKLNKAEITVQAEEHIFLANLVKSYFIYLIDLIKLLRKKHNMD